MKKILSTLTLLTTLSFGFTLDDITLSSEGHRVDFMLENANYSAFTYMKENQVYSTLVDYKDKQMLIERGIEGMSKREILKSNLEIITDSGSVAPFMVNGQLGYIDNTNGEVLRIFAYKTEEAFKVHNILEYKEYLKFLLVSNSCHRILKNDYTVFSNTDFKKGRMLSYYEGITIHDFEPLYNYFNDSFLTLKINGESLVVDRLNNILNLSSDTYKFYKTEAACKRAIK